MIDLGELYFFVNYLKILRCFGEFICPPMPLVLRRIWLADDKYFSTQNMTCLTLLLKQFFPDAKEMNCVPQC